MKSESLQCPSCIGYNTTIYRKRDRKTGETVFTADCNECGAIFSGTEKIEREYLITNHRETDGDIYKSARDVLHKMSLDELKALEQKLIQESLIKFKNKKWSVV